MDEPAPSPHPAGQRDLINGPIGSTLLAFALPTLGSNVLQSLNGSINTIWVGRFLGENALAATSNANIIKEAADPDRVDRAVERLQHVGPERRQREGEQRRPYRAVDQVALTGGMR